MSSAKAIETVENHGENVYGTGDKVEANIEKMTKTHSSEDNSLNIHDVHDGRLASLQWEFARLAKFWGARSDHSGTLSNTNAASGHVLSQRHATAISNILSKYIAGSGSSEVPREYDLDKGTA